MNFCPVFISQRPITFRNGQSISFWPTRTPSTEGLQREPQPQQEDANQPPEDEQDQEMIYVCGRRLYFRDPHVIRLMLIGTSLVVVVPWLVAVGFLTYHRNYILIGFVSFLFLSSLAVAIVKLVLLLGNDRRRKRQMQRNADPPPYESVVAKPPEYNQLYGTTAATNFNENTPNNPPNPENSANPTDNPDGIISLPTILCIHENHPRTPCKYCRVLVDRESMDATLPPSYEETIRSSSSCRPTHEDARY